MKTLIKTLPVTLAFLFLLAGGSASLAFADCYGQDDYYDDCEDDEEEDSQDYDEDYEDNDSGSTLGPMWSRNPFQTKVLAVTRCYSTTCKKQVGKWVRKAVTAGTKAGAITAIVTRNPKSTAVVAGAATATELVWEVKTVWEPCTKCREVSP